MAGAANSDRRHPGPVLLVSSRQLFGEVHGIAHRATIAASKDRPFNFECVDETVGCFFDSLQNRVVSEERIQGFSGRNKVRSDVCYRHSVDPPTL
jgi:hypothetical protein